LGALLGLAALVGLLMLIEIPIVTESMRMGRHLELRLRMALLNKLPQLNDRYFHSRPVSDMAERSHAIHLSRQVPGFGLQFIQTFCDLGFTLLGIALIDRASFGLALGAAAAAMALPWLVQPLLGERDLRARSHGGALQVFNLDALLGLVPIRTHSAERAVQRQQEGLLVQWARASRSLVRMALAAKAVQSVVGLGLVCALLCQHFQRAGGATGADLLLVYWALKLPALGQALMGLAQQYPAQRNVLLRLLEPITAPGAAPPPVPANPPCGSEPETPGMGIAVAGGKVVAGGHTILDQIDLRVAPGDHVAVVGSSGAGKSTLLGLLLGWHRLAEGELVIDGAVMSEAGQERLRRSSAWVDPGIQLWNLPLLENLRYACADDATRDTGAVLDAADLRQVLQHLPDGLQTFLGEGGALLSGGEGQRVRLARALMQTGVRLALLDEPFRGLDRAQRASLLAQCRQWWHRATLLCVTHDILETQSFDRVLVVEDGCIAEDGRPADLAAGPTRYRALLNAEIRVRARMWDGPQWRHIRIAHGRVETVQAPADGGPLP
jgi:ATP-binding cassette subfamily B protein